MTKRLAGKLDERRHAVALETEELAELRMLIDRLERENARLQDLVASLTQEGSGRRYD